MLSIIVPTIGRKNPELERLFDSLEKQTSMAFEVILAIQDNYDEVIRLSQNYSFAIKTLKLFKKGLSYARNQSLAQISHSTTLVTFSDDDCWYPKYAIATVLENYIKYGKSICYQIFDPIDNQLYKYYEPDKLAKVSLRQSLKISSIEIFVPKTIIDRGICFDERFGLGAAFPSGEENIFLFNVIKQGFEIIYLPQPVVYHLKPVWGNKEYIFKGKGALFSRLYNKPFGLLMSFIYAFMKRKHSVNITSDLTNMIKEAIYFKK